MLRGLGASSLDARNNARVSRVEHVMLSVPVTLDADVKKRGAPATRTIRTTIVLSELLVNDLCSEQTILVKVFFTKIYSSQSTTARAVGQPATLFQLQRDVAIRHE